MTDTMMRIWISRLGCVLLLTGIAVASAQDRAVGPLPSLAPLVEGVAPGVVNIGVSGTVEVRGPFTNDPLFERFFGDQLDQRPLRGEGSGVIVDATEGYLLTNHHVIENADEITVTLSDGRQFSATVIGSDADSDLAVVKIEGNDLTDIPFASNDDLRVGDYVVAIGNPLGFENTVTAGIVSGLGRGLNPNSSAYEDFIQTDASINVGNSGGALVNLRGELVGINSAIVSQTGGNIGIGLAIPVDMARTVMDQLIEFGDVQHGLLGVIMQTLTPDTAEEFGYSVTEGAQVTEVIAGSAADAAGIRKDDVIVGVNGEPMATGNELRNRIGFMRPGEEVNIDIVRDGRRRTIAVVLRARPEDAPISREIPREFVPDPDPILEGLELFEGERFGMRGLVVVAVEPRSAAGLQGVEEGDLITSINRRPVATRDQARAIVDSARFIQLEIRRGNRNFAIRVR